MVYIIHPFYKKQLISAEALVIVSSEIFTIPKWLFGILLKYRVYSYERFALWGFGGGGGGGLMCVTGR